MGTTLIVDDQELAPVLSGTHLSTTGRWKTELALQQEEIGISVGMTSTGNRTQVTHMVGQWFSHYATAAWKLVAQKKYFIQKVAVPGLFCC